MTTIIGVCFSRLVAVSDCIKVYLEYDAVTIWNAKWSKIHLLSHLICLQ